MSDAPPWLSRLADGSLDEAVEVEGGTLHLVGDRVVACDPLVFLEGSDPFAREVKPGDYPILIGRVEGEIAYAKLELADGDVERWEVARVPGEEEVEGWPGYAVDAGVGAFLDRATLARFLEVEEAHSETVRQKLEAEGLIDPEDPAYDARFEEIRAELGDDPVADLDTALRKRDHASVVIDPKSKGNVVAFKSGSGNGVFASFWGLSAKGEPLCLVTDFGLIDESSDLEELAGLDEDGLDELGGELSDLGGLEALAAALGMQGEPEPEERQGPSPLFLQAKELLQRWVKEEKIELEPTANLDDFAEAFLYKLSSLSGHRNPGMHIGEWLVDRREVADVFASDDELEADLRG